LITAVIKEEDITSQVLSFGERGNYEVESGQQCIV